MHIEKINELFKCKFCNEIYKEPIVLSCGHKICKKDLCLITMENKVKFQQISRCHICMETMVVPENGFPVDKDFNVFAIMTDFKGIDFGDKYKHVREAIDSLKNDIEQMKYLFVCPDYFIFEYFQLIRNKIEMERIELVDEINKHFSSQLEEVNLLEQESKLLKPFNKSTFAGPNLVSKIQTEIESFEKHHKRLSSEIDIMRVDEENWEKTTFESNYQRMKLSRVLKYHQNNILNNKNYSFVSKKAAIESTLSNSAIKIEECQASSASDKGYVQFCLTDFKNFSKRKGSLFRTEQCELGGYKWNLKLRNLDEQYLCWTLHCDMTDVNKIINCTIRFEIMNPSDPEKNYSRRLKLAFNSSRIGHGIEKFISYQDLFKNGFYDESNDSIHINYYIALNDVLKLNY